MPYSSTTVSALALRDGLRGRRRLNEGAARVLQKLETFERVAGLRRVYLRAGSSVTMWDSSATASRTGSAKRSRPSSGWANRWTGELPPASLLLKSAA